MDSSRQLIISNANVPLLDEALEFLTAIRAGTEVATRPLPQEVLLVAPTRGAADDLVFRFVRKNGSRGGVHRYTPVQLALVLATPGLAAGGLAPLSALGQEALAARSVAKCPPGYFTPVADTPGFARALAATLEDLSREGLGPQEVADHGEPGQDLARLLAAYQEELSSQGLADRAEILRQATLTARGIDHPLLGLPLVALSPPLESFLERDFWSAVFARTPAVLAAALAYDGETVKALEEMLGVRARYLEVAGSNSDQALDRLRRRIFVPRQVSGAPEETDSSVELFSAPGESLECAELARRILRAACAGVPFDRMAVLLRHPDAYQPLLEEALERACVPSYFTRGVLRPDPAGRALLALLDCACEGLSASKFGEYLSLGQVPRVDESGAPPERLGLWQESADEAQASFKFAYPEPDPVAAEAEESDEAPVVAGSLQAPFLWEKLLVDAAVIGGRDRWRRRLNGLEAEFRRQLEEAQRSGDDRTPRLEQQLVRLGHLRRFALPVIDLLASFTEAARWGEWLERLRHLAAMVLRRPERVLETLGEFEPMAETGPVGLEEVRQTLAQRLKFLRSEPAGRRYGKVFVATLDEARARSFEIVFIPGLAEGLFPARPAEDPLLLDEYRRALSPLLMTRAGRVGRERRLLGVGLAAAQRRLCVSYPRTEVLEGRARVPSVLALETLAAVEARLPPVKTFERRAAEAAEARLGWPAPRATSEAIDDAEYDLAFLEPLLKAEPEKAKGRAAYLLKVNEHLARSLRTRWQRWKGRWQNGRWTGGVWSGADGIVDPDAPTLEALALHAPRQVGVSYSASALQHFAACPYRFLLNAIYHLTERKALAALEELDPLTRGSLFHEAQKRLFCALKEAGLLPVTEGRLPHARQVSDRVFKDVADEYKEELAPAINPVWDSQIESLLSDFRGWVMELPKIHAEWMPVHFEFGFGLHRSAAEDRDPASRKEPAVILGGLCLRGIIDLIERHSERPVLRVTDYKTGKLPAEAERPVSVGRGDVLQPALYGLAAEELLGEQVESGTLFYATARAGYTLVDLKLDNDTRERIGTVIDTIEQHVRRGFLPAAPRENACLYCAFRPACGPYEETRVQRKPQERLEPLNAIRRMP